MAAVLEILPSPVLRDYVRSYHYTEMSAPDGPLLSPVTARPEQMLQFSLRQPFTVLDHRRQASGPAPDAVLVGRQTRRNFDLVAEGDVTTLTVHFQPAGFYRLFHVPMVELTDLAPDAVDVMGPGVVGLHERVAHSPNPSAMVAHVEEFLATKLDRRRPGHPVHAAAAAMLDHGSAPTIRAAARWAGVSDRQFERTFLAHVGVPPKLFSRVVRFAAALQAKSDCPDRAWADIAVTAGYADQTHFIRDCRTFGGDSPTVLMQTWMDCRP